MEIYPDEKWEPSKKEQSRSRSRRERPPAEAGPDQPVCLRRSASTMEARAAAPAATPRSFSRRCSGLVKEQRAKFYIVRRCVSMLMCWRERLD